MSVLVELNIEYNRFFSRAVIALAREDYVAGRMYLERAAKALNEIAVRRTGENRDYTQDWVFDIVKEIGDLDRRINNERSKEKVMKMLAEKGKLKTSENTVENKFAGSNIPTTSFDDIAGLEDVKEAVMYKAIYPHKYPELYEKLRKRSGGGILLYGLPGTGKTLIAEAIAHETGASFFPVKCSDLGSKWFGETEQNIRDVFEAAREAKNAVIFFDEIEAYASNRRENSAMERSIPEFLAQMQGVGESNNQERILIIGATNKPWRLDGAFLRPGRFDDKIYVPLPDEKARRKIIDDRVLGVPMEEGIDFETLAKITDGYNGADMDYLCEKAKEFALHRVIQDKDTKETLTKADFALAIECVKSSVLEVDRKEMELWINNNRA
ncbi:MAG: ATP-binding protein [Clostridia bacterium]|nr:ATP-binding protein [Clostridia bacterium]